MPMLPSFLTEHLRSPSTSFYTDVKWSTCRGTLCRRSYPSGAAFAISQPIARKPCKNRMVVVASTGATSDKHGTPPRSKHRQPQLPGFLLHPHRRRLAFPGSDLAARRDRRAARQYAGERRRDSDVTAPWRVRARPWRGCRGVHIARDMAAGRLVPVLEAFNPGDEEPLHAIYVGQGGHVPARVRAFLDFLAANVRLPG